MFKIKAIIIGLLGGMSTLANAQTDVLGKKFCIIGEPQSGYSFHQDGTASYFAPNLGMPNPFTENRVVSAPGDNGLLRIELHEYRKETNEFLGIIATFYYHPKSGELTSRTAVMSPDACTSPKSAGPLAVRDPIAIRCTDGKFVGVTSVDVDLIGSGGTFRIRKEELPGRQIHVTTGSVVVRTFEDKVQVMDLFEGPKEVGTLIALGHSYNGKLVYRDLRINNLSCHLFN